MEYVTWQGGFQDPNGSVAEAIPAALPGPESQYGISRAQLRAWDVGDFP